MGDLFAMLCVIPIALGDLFYWQKLTDQALVWSMDK